MRHELSAARANLKAVSLERTGMASMRIVWAHARFESAPARTSALSGWSRRGSIS
ncbi:non-hypothetical protein [Azotobacter vinelandii CA]|uniref:Uncharacterized protein n=2 Tax=Azotobacter vinelandii TaxID=354 RepID=C1DEG5_AZOVD|nr:non-conserved hypothetical protein [Azotobacter vinelandii DJ]AGK15114.1 non-hypothetical protein [Azotobacter vinelandii CA]AGK20291.1 non-hypothetical protein [Azotobacter vinelandii CA6]